MGKYFKNLNFSLNTIQGQIRVGFSVTVILLLILMVFRAYNSKLINTKNDYQFHVVQPSKYYILSFSQAINKSFVELENFLKYDNSNTRNRNTALFTLQQEAQKESLNKLFELMDKMNIRKDLRYTKSEEQLIKDLENNYHKLHKIYELLTIYKVSLKQNEQEQINDQLAKCIIIINEINRIAQDDLIESFDKRRKAKTFEVSQKPFLSFELLLLLVLIIITIFTFATIIVHNLTDKLNRVESYLSTLSQGGLIQSVEESDDEFQNILNSVFQLNNQLRNVKNFAIDVGKEKFDTNINVFNQVSELGNSLEGMKDSLKMISANEKKRIWQSDGINTLAEVIRGNIGNIKELTDKFLNELINYSKVNQGGVFIYNETKKVLELKAFFAYGRKKYIDQEIEIGHGLTGEVFRDGETLFLSDIPSNYISITSGLGKARPSSLAIIPIKYQDEVLGVLELASFDYFEDHELEFFEKVSEVLASNLLNISNNAKTKILLKESQRYTQKLNAQEQELRQNTEELIATREGLEKKCSKLETDLKISKNAIKESKVPIAQIDSLGNILNRSIGFIKLFFNDNKKTDINIFDLLPTTKNAVRNFGAFPATESFENHIGKLKNGIDISLKVNISRSNFHNDTYYTFIMLNEKALR